MIYYVCNSCDGTGTNPPNLQKILMEGGARGKEMITKCTYCKGKGRRELNDNFNNPKMYVSFLFDILGIKEVEYKAYNDELNPKPTEYKWKSSQEELRKKLELFIKIVQNKTWEIAEFRLVETPRALGIIDKFFKS